MTRSGRRSGVRRRTGATRCLQAAISGDMQSIANDTSLQSQALAADGTAQAAAVQAQTQSQ